MSTDRPVRERRRLWLRLRRRIPFWGRLEWRITFALVALGILGVGSSSYLVMLTVRYYDAIEERQAATRNEAFELTRPYYEALATAKRESFEARTNSLASDLALFAPTNEREWLERRIGATTDVFETLIERPGRDPVRVEGAGARLMDETWRRVPITKPLVDGGRVQVTYGVDPVYDANWQRLGRLVRDADTVPIVGIEADEMVRVDRDALARGVLGALGTASGIVLLLAIAAGLVISRQTTRKVTDLSTVMRKVATGDLSARAPRLGDDELGQLATAFNAMLDELDASRRRIEYLQRIGAWQEMARRIAHEIKNPLTPIQLAVQQLRDKDPRTNPEFSALLAESTEIVEDEIEGLRRMVGSFSRFAKVPDVHLESISLRRILEEFERAYGHLGEEGDELVVEPLEPDVLVLADRQLLKHVLVNLVENAVFSGRDALVSPIRVRLHASLVGQGKDRRVSLCVEDNGPGIEEARRERVFEPYETTRDHGTGLGLAIVKKIILDHAGDIRVEASPLGGASFIIELPLVS